jgi:hypothetical protein
VFVITFWHLCESCESCLSPVMVVFSFAFPATFALAAVAATAVAVDMVSSMPLSSSIYFPPLPNVLRR